MVRSAYSLSDPDHAMSALSPRRARKNGLQCPIVLLTAFPASEVFDETERLGHVTVLGKPIDLDAVTQCVNDLLARARSELVA